jgi:hypothetical protein
MVKEIEAEYKKQVGANDSKQVDRILHLSEETDRHYLIEKSKQRTDLPLSCDELEKAVAFLSNKLDEEWLIFLSMGSCFNKNRTKELAWAEFLLRSSSSRFGTDHIKRLKEV